MNNRAAIAGLFGLAGILLTVSAQAQSAPAETGPAMAAALPENKSATPIPTVTGQAVPTESIIVATVNDEAITQHDLDERVALFMAMSGPQFRPTDEEKAKYRQRILTEMEGEMLRLQEAARKGITVSPNEIDAQLERMAKSGGSTTADMMEMIKRGGGNVDVLRDQIKVSLAWRSLLNQEYGERVQSAISEADVDAELSRRAQGATKPRFHVLEIFLAVETQEEDPKIKKEAQDIYEQIKAGANFQNVARQFSQDPSAAMNGDIGWVYDGLIDAEIIKVLDAIKPGVMSEPVRARGGYYILYLLERQEPAGTQVVEPKTAAEEGLTKLPLVRILVPLGAKPDKKVADQLMQSLSESRLRLPPCGAELKKLSEDNHFIYLDMGEFPIADLSPELQKSLLATHAGEGAEPLLSDAGVEFMVRCDARQEIATPFQLPSRDQVASDIFSDRISQWARRLESDLRRHADVQVR